MIWLTWRQHRMEAVGAIIALSIVAGFLLLTGLPMRAAFDDRVQQCLNLSGGAYLQHGCQGVLRDFETEATFNDLIAYFNFLPALAGLFIGAPLVAREIERGTHRLVWTQGITRLRWISTKLMLVTAGCAITAVAFTVAMTWWRAPIDQVQGSLLPVGFDFEGVMPTAYALFAFALGVAIGTVICRTVPAMAITLLAFLAIRLPVEDLLRPHYMAPLTTISAATQPGADPRLSGRGDWILQGGLMDSAHHRLTNAEMSQLYSMAAKGADNTKGGADAYVQAHGYLSYVDLHPASRFWAFQGIEAAIFVGLAVLLLAFTVWWVRSRSAG